MTVQAAAAPAEAARASRALLDKVGKIFSLLGQTLRAYQLYGPANPTTNRMLDASRTCFEELWMHVPEIELSVTPDSILLENTPVYQHSDHAESLAYILFRDGIRTLGFHPGFEREEMPELLKVLHKARYQPSESDDLVTLLWEEDFVAVRYGYVDAEADTRESRQRIAEIGSGQTGAYRALAAQAQIGAARPGPTATVAASGGYDPAAYTAAADPPALPGMNAGPQRASLHLDPEALLYLQRELEEEMHRDVRQDVVSALIDCFEEPDPKSQSEILAALTSFVPSLVASRQLRLASELLSELRAVSARPGVVDDTRRHELQLVLEGIAASTPVREFLGAIESGEIHSDLDCIGSFLVHLGPGLLQPLLRARAKSTGKELRAALDSAAEKLAREHLAALGDALQSQDPLVARGALRVQVGLGRTDAIPLTVRLLQHAEAGVRLAAVEALIALGGPVALPALEGALEDGARDVRVAALWGLATWQHKPALPRLERALKSKSFRRIEPAEKMALLDAYARIGGEDAIAHLDGLLNARSFLRPKEPADLRAYAARALGLTGSPEAKRALERAQRDRDPEVRRAVQRSCRKFG